MTSDVARHTVHTLVFRSLKRTHDTFIADHGCLPDNGTFQIPYVFVFRTNLQYFDFQIKLPKK